MSDRDLASTLEVKVGTLPHRLQRGRRGRWAPCRYILCKRAEEVKVPALLLFGKKLRHLFLTCFQLVADWMGKANDWDWFAAGCRVVCIEFPGELANEDLPNLGFIPA